MNYLIALLLSILLALQPPAQSPLPDAAIIVIPAEMIHIGSVASIARDIRVVGTVQGDVTSISGDILVSGVVTGDVVSYRGQVVLAERARVDGHVLVLGSTASRARDARVTGQVIGTVQPFDASLPAQVIAPSNSGSVSTYLLLAGTLLAFLLMLALTAVTLLAPRTLRSGQVVLALPGYTTLLGLVSGLLLSGVLLLLGLVLALTLVGIPLAITLLLLLHLPLLYGLIIGAQALALRLTGKPAVRLTLLFSMLLLLPPLAVGWYLPLGGVALLYLLASGGIGALVLSRGGLLLPAPQLRLRPPT